MRNFRIGCGYDVHQLKENNSLILGGVTIPHYKGTVAHSDGDVVLHAICDALLGAANLGDIGYHFPDTNPRYKDVDSKILLSKVMNMIREKGYELGNIDSTICLQKPKVGIYIPKMKKSLAYCMSVPQDLISIKATTTEKIGFVGREEGVSAYCTVLINNV